MQTKDYNQIGTGTWNYIIVYKLVLRIVAWSYRCYKWLPLVTWNHLIAWKNKRLTSTLNNPTKVDKKLTDKLTKIASSST